MRHRIGKGQNRPIWIKLVNYADKFIIFKNATHLKGKKNSAGKGFFIQNDLSEKTQEEQRWQRQIVSKNKMKVVNRLNMSFTQNKLMIQNKTYAKQAPTPSMGELLIMSREQRQLVQNIKLVTMRERKELGNTFIGYATRAYDIREVREAYQHLKLKHPDATHIVVAHSFADPRPELTDYSDDGEVGAGRRMVDLLLQNNTTEIAVYIVRYHSGRNLGPRRFELILELTQECIDMVQQDQVYVPSISCPKLMGRIQIKSRKSRGYPPMTRGGTQATSRARGQYHKRARQATGTQNSYFNNAEQGKMQFGHNAADAELVLANEAHAALQHPTQWEKNNPQFPMCESNPWTSADSESEAEVIIQPKKTAAWNIS